MNPAVCLGLYAVLCVGYLVGNHRWSRYQAARTVRIGGIYPADVPVWPPITQADIDSAWLDVWPSAVDDDELTDLEFVSLIASTWDWPWPDTEDAA